MKVSAVLAFIGALVAPSFVNAYVPPGADTPAFHLVSTSADGSSNLLPLRITGGTGGYATLTGSGPVGVFYFRSGRLVAAGSPEYRPLIGPVLTGSGCTTYGALGFTQGSSSNKCSVYDSFYIQSNSENGQLGARLSFNFAGQFYACGAGRDVFWKPSPSDGPQDCNPVDLYTVAASQ